MKLTKELQQKAGGSLFSELRRLPNQLPQHTSKMPVNFIPLNEIITFFTLNLVRPEYARFSESEFERFFAADTQKQTVHEAIYQTSQAWVDESFEGDIYSQNKYRSRSIIEEMSNSIDAQPEEIHCTRVNDHFNL